MNIVRTSFFPNMLLVGASGRDAGKTALVCSLIKRFSEKHGIIGVKVTPVDAERDACPRGGTGCGACDALASDFEFSEEKERDPKKDTGRMLIAGAKRALWLRSRRTCLPAALVALAQHLPSDALCICESTSTRAVLEPGLFLIAERRGSHERKSSAQAVWRDADRIVGFDGQAFDLDLRDISAAKGRWALKRDATAIVMAGGASSRMGTNKALLEIDGKPMIARIADQLRPHFKEILISANDPETYAFLQLPVIVDREKGCGPLMGITSALAASSHDLAFVHACDIPHTDLTLMQRLLRAAWQHDAAVPRTADGRPEPLFAAYRKSLLPAMNEALARGERKIRQIFENSHVAILDLCDLRGLTNLNTPEDHAIFKREDVDLGR